jgi:hypothetical protein
MLLDTQHRESVFDRYIECLHANTPMPPDIADITEAAEDIRLIRISEHNAGNFTDLSH